MNLLLAHPLGFQIIIPFVLGALLWIAYDLLDYVRYNDDPWSRLAYEISGWREWLQIAPFMLLTVAIYAFCTRDLVIFGAGDNWLFAVVAAAMLMEGWLIAGLGEAIFWLLILRRHRVSNWLKRALKQCVDAWVMIGKSYGPF